MTTFGAVTVRGVVHSELIKFLRSRSTWATLAAAVGTTVGLGVLLSWLRVQQLALGPQVHAAPGNPAPVFHGRLDPTLISLRGLVVAQLVLGVLAMSMATGEYSTGLIRTSLLAVPRRWTVLSAKAMVMTAVFVVVGCAATLTAFVGGQATLSAGHLGVSLAAPGAIRAILGGGVYVALIGLFALGLGFTVRRTSSATAVLLGVLFVLPLLADALPPRWYAMLNPYLPVNAGWALMSTVRQPGTLGPWQGGVVFATYAATALVIGAFTLHRRDA